MRRNFSILLVCILCGAVCLFFVSSPGQKNPSSHSTVSGFQFSGLPDYSGAPVVEVHHNVPFFSDTELTDTAAVHLSELDSLGRCQQASACLGPETVASGERGSLGMIKPSGWKTVRYEEIEDGYLYNRCHLLMWKASSVLDDERNLITGTRYLNIQGMLPYEEKLLKTIQNRGVHVLYRVTPVFEGKNLLASGVLMEAKSVEDSGRDLQFCVYAYNVQPGITIDYRTGESHLVHGDSGQESASESKATNYVLNTHTKKFHTPECSSVREMKTENQKKVRSTRKKLLAKGYEPCKSCNP